MQPQTITNNIIETLTSNDQNEKKFLMEFVGQQMKTLTGRDCNN